MAKSRLIPTGTRARNTVAETAELAMPKDANSIRVWLPKTAWASGDSRINLTVERSLDAGKTWERAGFVSFGRAYHYRGPLAGQEVSEPFAEFASRKLGGREGVLYRARVETKGASERFALDAEFNTVTFAPQHHSVSIEDIDGAYALSATSVSTGTITPAGSDRGVLVQCANDDGLPSTVSTISYAGNASSSDAYSFVHDTYFRQEGAHTFSDVSSAGVGNYTVLLTQYSLNVCAIAVSGLDSWDTAVTGSASTASSVSVNVPNMATGDMILARCYGYANSLSILSGETIEDSDIGYDGGGDSVATISEQGTGTVTVGMSRGSTESYGFGIAAIRAIAAAGGGTQYEIGINPSISLAASLANFKTFARSIPASASLANSTGKALSANKAIPGSITGASTISKVSSRLKSISAEITLTALVSVSSLRLLSISASISVSASIALLFVRLISISAEVITSAAFGMLSAHLISISAGVSVAAAIAIVSARKWLIDASVTVAASISAPKTILIAVSAGITAGASVVPLSTVLYYVDILTGVSVSASLAKVSSFLVLIAASTTLTAALSLIVSRLKEIITGVTVSASIGAQRLALVAISAGVTLAASLALTPVVVHYVAISAGITAVASLAFVLAYGRAISSTITTSAAFTRLQAVSRFISATANMVPGISLGLSVSRFILASIVVSPLITTRKTVLRGVSATISFLSTLVALFIPSGALPPSQTGVTVDDFFLDRVEIGDAFLTRLEIEGGFE